MEWGLGVNKREDEQDSNPGLSDQLLSSPGSSSVLALSVTKAEFCVDRNSRAEWKFSSCEFFLLLDDLISQKSCRAGSASWTQEPAGAGASPQEAGRPQLTSEETLSGS